MVVTVFSVTTVSVLSKFWKTRWWLSSWGLAQIVTSSPLQNLRIAKLLGCMLLIQALQLTVVPLIESPVLLTRNPIQIHFVYDAIIWHNRSFKHRCVPLIECEASLFQSPPCRPRLLYSLITYTRISPTLKSICLIPHWQAVSHKHNPMNLHWSPPHIFLIILWI